MSWAGAWGGAFFSVFLGGAAASPSYGDAFHSVVTFYDPLIRQQKEDEIVTLLLRHFIDHIMED